jgi:ribonuclease P protein component
LAISSLKNQAAFDKINQKGQRLHSPYCTIVILENVSASLPKYTDHISLGMKVSKKLGNAVIRNKIKRRIRHLIRIIPCYNSLNINLALIFIPKKNFDKVEFATLVNTVSHMLNTKSSLRDR